MEIRVKRIYKGLSYTIGKLYINGEYFCDTLEDADRGLDDSMELEKILELKKPSITAIPTGTYKVLITYSPRFKQNMPLLCNVKGFEGIRIHSGNVHQHTSGCLLVGENKEVGKVLNSKVTYTKLFNILNECNEDITITIE